VSDPTTSGGGTGSQPGEGRLSHASMSGSELLDQLRATLDRAGELVRVIERDLGAARGGGAAALGGDAERTRDLEARLAAAEADVKELAARLVDSEHQAGRLMNLYVATYQLHATLHPAEVQQTIAEIAINLLGAERFVLLLKEEEDLSRCEVALGEASEDDPLYAGGRYEGGDPMVDQALGDGVLRLGPYDGSRALAAVPLRVHDAIVGALVILKLFDHKPMLRGEDRDLLDLLSAHAASALFAARLYSAKDRKLRSIESLVKLARGEK
jgi:hypothetical protein